MISLRNGSRISESVEGMRRLMVASDIKKKVTVKVAKSKSKKYNKETGDIYYTKIRYRNIIFPYTWVEISDNKNDIKNYLKLISTDRLKKRVLDFLRLKFEGCNTHSLRYACINYLIHTKEKPINEVCKFVAHSNTNQIVRYTQQHNADKIFELEI